MRFLSNINILSILALEAAASPLTMKADAIIDSLPGLPHNNSNNFGNWLMDKRQSDKTSMTPGMYCNPQFVDSPAGCFDWCETIYHAVYTHYNNLGHDTVCASKDGPINNVSAPGQPYDRYAEKYALHKETCYKCAETYPNVAAEGLKKMLGQCEVFPEPTSPDCSSYCIDVSSVTTEQCNQACQVVLGAVDLRRNLKRQVPNYNLNSIYCGDIYYWMVEFSTCLLCTKDTSLVDQIKAHANVCGHVDFDTGFIPSCASSTTSTISTIYSTSTVATSTKTIRVTITLPDASSLLTDASIAVTSTAQSLTPSSIIDVALAANFYNHTAFASYSNSTSFTFYSNSTLGLPSFSNTTASGVFTSFGNTTTGCSESIMLGAPKTSNGPSVITSKGSENVAMSAKTVYAICSSTCKNRSKGKDRVDSNPTKYPSPSLQPSNISKGDKNSSPNPNPQPTNTNRPLASNNSFSSSNIEPSITVPTLTTSYLTSLPISETQKSFFSSLTTTSRFSSNETVQQRGDRQTNSTIPSKPKGPDGMDRTNSAASVTISSVITAMIAGTITLLALTT